MLDPHEQGFQPANPLKHRVNAHAWFGAPAETFVPKVSPAFPTTASGPQQQEPLPVSSSDAKYPTGTSTACVKRENEDSYTTHTPPTSTAQPQAKRTYKKREKKPLGHSAFLLAIPYDAKISLGTEKEEEEEEKEEEEI
jgi:hypothetical protein